jgi:hypothetical protein
MTRGRASGSNRGCDNKKYQRNYITINQIKQVQREAKTQRSDERIRNVRDETTDDVTRSDDKRCSMQHNVGCCGWDNTTTNQTQWRGDKEGETGVRRQDEWGERSGERGEVADDDQRCDERREEERGERRKKICWVLTKNTERACFYIGIRRWGLYVRIYVQTSPDTEKYLKVCRVSAKIGTSAQNWQLFFVSATFRRHVANIPS